MTVFDGVRRLPTGVPGFDAIAHGGLPEGRSTLVVGTAGSGKTVFAAQYLATGAEAFGQPGVFVTFDETPESILRNTAGFDWRFDQAVDDQRIAIVDCSPDPATDLLEVGDFDFRALIARISAAVQHAGARRLVLDSVTALLAQFASEPRVRRELSRVVHAANALGVTTVLTAERTEEFGRIGRFGVEEFVADAVVVLRNPLDEQRRRRTIEILKYRGGPHQSGEFPVTIESGDGFGVIPLSAIELERPAAEERVSLGNPGVDELFGGGVYRDSLILVSGPTGTGKTLMSLGFAQAAVDAGERALMMSFEESHNQLVRNAQSWLPSLREHGEAQRLRLLAAYPERMGLEDLLQLIRREVEHFRPSRVALDSLTALERVSSRRAFREFVVRLTTIFKEASIAGMFTNTSSMISGGETITDAYVSTMTDGIVLLRYVEVAGELRRAVHVLKMRGSDHDRSIREFTIGPAGMQIGAPMAGPVGLIIPARADGGSLDG